MKSTQQPFVLHQNGQTMQPVTQPLFKDIRQTRSARTQRIWPDAAWPAAANARSASLFREDMQQALHAQGREAVLAMAGTDALLDCLGGNSPYLSDLALQDAVFFAALLEKGPSVCGAEVFATLTACDITVSYDHVAQTLRIAKKRVALLCAVADLGGFWPLEDVTQTLSRLADVTLEVALRHLMWAAHQSGQIQVKDPKRPTYGCGFFVLAMGKLGARELNFSSDIDLMVLYDPSGHKQPDAVRRVFIRMTSDLVRLMEARDADGYVFRTDLRLRPDPASTPPAVSVQAAIVYYESLGQTWERAAMIKARPVAGDLALGRSFLAAIRPFVWRRHLDFALIDDIHTMKARIDHYRNTGRTGLATLSESVVADPQASMAWLLGHNLKLGQGGIREIEFIAQAMQLVWGGRDPDLREKTTFGALKKLVRLAYLPREEAEVLARTYRLLRDAEHRLQMRSDQQTHSLPEQAEAFDAFGVFMGFADGAALALDLLPRMREARRIFERHFVTQPHPADEQDQALLAVAPDNENSPVILQKLGFPQHQAADAAQVLARWQGNSLRALRSERAHALLRTLLPALLASFTARSNPLACLRRFDALLTRQHAGVQLLSLFERNPALIDRITALFDASAFLADHLADTPSALEGLLEPEPEEGRNVQARLRQLAQEVEDTEMLVTALRPLLRGEEFRLSVAVLEARMSEDEAERARTALADTIMTILKQAVEKDHIRRYGRVPGGSMAVIALGKVGSREMMPGSDLDLLLVFDHPEDQVVSQVGKAVRRVTAEGLPLAAPRSVAVSQYYTRLAHAFIAALTAPGPEGPLYAVDMRLRPSGAAGPVAVPRRGLMQYHRDAAWTWERMALTRARIITAPVALRKAFSEDIAAILEGRTRVPSAETATILADACAMRARLARDLPATGPWDVKRRAGGLMEVEFIAQTLQLVGADKAVRDTCTRRALVKLGKAGLIEAADLRLLLQADSAWRRLQGVLRLLCGPVPPLDLEKELAPPSRAVVLRAMRVETLPDLVSQSSAMARAVRHCFNRLIGPVAEGDAFAEVMVEGG